MNFNFLDAVLLIDDGPKGNPPEGLSSEILLNADQIAPRPRIYFAFVLIKIMIINVMTS